MNTTPITSVNALRKRNVSISHLACRSKSNPATPALTSVSIIVSARDVLAFLLALETTTIQLLRQLQ
jgi:hypothetical protein